MEINHECHQCKTPREDLKETPYGHNISNGVWGILCRPCHAQNLKDKIDEWNLLEADTDYKDDPICPNCGTVQGGAWEWAQGGGGSVECGTCDYEMSWSRHISITYSTK